MPEVNETRALECNEGPVSLDVVIGEGQTGHIAVFRNGTLIAEGFDVLEDVALGECGEQPPARITVRATVNVVNEQTGRTSLACVVKSPGMDRREVIAGPEVGSGEQVRFRIECARGSASP